MQQQMRKIGANGGDKAVGQGKGRTPWLNRRISKRCILSKYPADGVSMIGICLAVNPHPDRGVSMMPEHRTVTQESGLLPVGYRMTELGPLPEEWQAVLLPDADEERAPADHLLNDVLARSGFPVPMVELQELEALNIRGILDKEV